MAQYRNIQDVPLILVGTQGIRKFFNSFPVIVCLNPFSPVMFRLKTFLMSEDRFQYKGAAHSKLTRPAWWYQPNTLDHFCLTQRSFKIVDSLKEIKWTTIWKTHTGITSGLMELPIFCTPSILTADSMRLGEESFCSVRVLYGSFFWTLLALALPPVTLGAPNVEFDPSTFNFYNSTWQWMII